MFHVGTPMWEIALRTLAVYFVVVIGLRLFGKRQLGQMSIGDQGVWSIDFRVPKVRPGLYMVAFLCGPGGNTYFGSADLHSAWTRKPGGRVLKVRR